MYISLSVITDINVEDTTNDTEALLSTLEVHVCMYTYVE